MREQTRAELIKSVFLRRYDTALIIAVLFMFVAVTVQDKIDIQGIF